MIGNLKTDTEWQKNVTHKFKNPPKYLYRSIAFHDDKKPFGLNEFIEYSGINQQNGEFKLLFTNPSEFIARESTNPSGDKNELGVVTPYLCDHHLWEDLKTKENFRNETFNTFKEAHKNQIIPNYLTNRKQFIKDLNMFICCLSEHDHIHKTFDTSNHGVVIKFDTQTLLDTFNTNGQKKSFMRPVYYSPKEMELFCNTCSKQFYDKQTTPSSTIEERLSFSKFEEWVTTKTDRLKDEMEWRILVLNKISKNENLFIPIPTNAIKGMYYFSTTLGLKEHFEIVSSWANKHNIQWAEKVT